MSYQVDVQESQDWSCNACGVALEDAQIEVTYMGSKYPVSLPRCPKCGMVFIPERIAVGKMAEIEKILEDK